MAVQQFQFEAPEAVGFGGFTPEMDGLTGTIGAVSITGWTSALGGVSLGVALATSSDCFLVFTTSAIFTATFVAPEVSGLGGFSPEIDGFTGTIGAVSITGSTAVIMGFEPGVRLGTLESCLFALAVAPAVTSTLFTGSKLKGLFKCPNIWDWCIQQDIGKWRRVPWYRYGCRPPQCWRPDAEPFRDIPKEGREFHRASSTLLPEPGSGDIQLLEFRVPTGYDGIIYAVLQQFAGGGFLEGSGDLLWRIQINRRWLKDMANMDTTLGDYTSYLHLDEYIRLNSQQVVRYYVNVAAGAGARLDATGRVIVGVQGWYFPMQYYR